MQYYYLCDFFKELNYHINDTIYLDDCLYDRKFRNCLAHYGLGQYIKDNEVIIDDALQGLTIKAFGKDYTTTKQELYEILKELVRNIKLLILK